MDVSQFEQKIGLEFVDKSLLKQAFTHRSFINENRASGLEHNERLEFLGDAVLELAITNFLYGTYPDRDEGELTSFRSALVNATTCAEIAVTLRVGDFLLLSKGETKDTGRARTYILANALEAIIGSIYLDRGYDAAKDFIEQNFTPLMERIMTDGSHIDAKSMFQEKAQEFDGHTPQYKTMGEVGPDHDKQFTVGVFVGSEKVAEGSGKSKQDAEQMAAKAGLEARGWK